MPICVVCKKPIEEMAVYDYGQYFHTRCFFLRKKEPTVPEKGRILDFESRRQYESSRYGTSLSVRRSG